MCRQFGAQQRSSLEEWAKGTDVLFIMSTPHHGNGTQEIFETDPSIFYFSTHQ